MASLASLTKQWPILPLQRSQSLTYMPLIYSVSDDFTIDFPSGYEQIFNESITAATYFGVTLSFTNFNEFQIQLKQSLNKNNGGIVGKNTRENKNLDHDYHLEAFVQDRILYGVCDKDNMDTFMQLFITKLHEKLSGEVCTIRPRVAPRQGAEDRRQPKWGVITGDHIIPFTEDVNYKINTGQDFRQTINGQNYDISPSKFTQTNNQTNIIRPIIILESGGRKNRRRTKRTKRKKTKRRRTRRR